MSFKSWEHYNDRFKELDKKQFLELRKEVTEGKKQKCPECDGTEKCAYCKGVGYTYGPQYKKCPEYLCGGRGRYKVQNGGIVTCRRCQGKGQVKVSTREKIKCKHCGGTGKCSRCN